MNEIVNKVAASGLISIDLEEWVPQNIYAELDIKPWLFLEQILKEKEFREYLKAHDWAQYKNAHVAICCSADAVVPTWAFMLVASCLEPYAAGVLVGALKDYKEMLFVDKINSFDYSIYQDKRIVIKGCGEGNVSLSIYSILTNHLKKVAQSILFGEPCSTVPIWKKPKV